MSWRVAAGPNVLIYSVILAPWIPYFTLMGSGMAFEGWHTRGAYCFVTMVWAYPVCTGSGTGRKRLAADQRRCTPMMG